MSTSSRAGARRALPSVERLASALGPPHELAVQAAREAIDARRRAIADGAAVPGPAAGAPVAPGPGGADGEPAGDDLAAQARAILERLLRPSLRPVLNATGVIVHTNLGRAPLAAEAVAAVAALAGGYSNLELDLDEGERGSRQSHAVSVLCELTGARDALVVNNCAAAVLLGAASLARGREVIVSRGELVEIGGSFRMPDVVEASGARLVEVGTTNRTQLADYERAIGSETGAILRAHRSNFALVGFTEDVEIEDLCGLGTPVIDDVGSGALDAAMPAVAREPAVRRSVAAGAALTCFSGDKLLGGPQAGILVGTSAAVAAARSHPLARALRIDKLSLAALETTLRLYREPARARAEIPVLAMLETPREVLERRAARLADRLTGAGATAEVVESSCAAGGGALPLLELEGPAVAVATGALAVGDAAARLRLGDPPLIARVRRGRLLLEVRTLADGEVDQAATAVTGALAA
jgi:L-seryl-tRNA(Ser) seleniumtransferase